jgi:hypothetical protein
MPSPVQQHTTPSAHCQTTRNEPEHNFIQSAASLIPSKPMPGAGKPLLRQFFSDKQAFTVSGGKFFGRFVASSVETSVFSTDWCELQ